MSTESKVNAEERGNYAPDEITPAVLLNAIQSLAKGNSGRWRAGSLHQTPTRHPSRGASSNTLTRDIKFAHRN